MEIKSRFKTYRVEFVESLSLLGELAAEDDTFFVIDRAVYERYREQLSAGSAGRLFLMEAAEEHKTIATALAICEQMTAMPAKRNTHLVSIGGGIVQDVTGFVATSLYRGIRWTFLPTTLLAACDSCIGGKSSLNYKGFKNLLGSFYPPDQIYIYQPFFRSLSPRDYCSGLGEVVKFNVIAGKEGLAHIEADVDALLAHDYEKLEQYIQSSLEFKKKFIEADEFDRGERILLNFAHTFGHAYETVSRYAVPHGSAVALGMMTANAISVRRGMIPQDYADRIAAVCRKILTHVEIKKEYFDLKAVVSAIRKDKKQTDRNITAVLINEKYELSVFRDVEEEEIAFAINHLLSSME